MSKLSIIHSVSLERDGLTFLAKQGLASSASNRPLVVEADYVVSQQAGVLETASERELYNKTEDYPDAIAYGVIWCDQNTVLQLIGASGQVVLTVPALVPITIIGSMLANDSTTPISAEPSMEEVDKIVLGNYSGNDANYNMLLVGSPPE